MRKYLLLITLFLLMGIFQANNTTASPHAITEVSYSPSMAHSGTEITLVITFSDSSNISKVGSFYCRLEPEYFCHIPSYTMTKSGNSFTSSFIITETAGEVIGFDIFIEYVDGEEIILPGTEQLDLGMQIAEPLENIFYYQIEVEGESSTSESVFVGFIPAFIAVMLKKTRGS